MSWPKRSPDSRPRKVAGWPSRATARATLNGPPPIRGSTRPAWSTIRSIRASPATVIIGSPIVSGPGYPLWLAGVIPLAGRGDQVALVALAPEPGPAGRLGHHAPVVGEALVAGRGRLGDDGVGPVVVGHHRLGHATAPGPVKTAGRQEDPEPLERAAAAAVGDVLVGLERRPVARGRGEIPLRRAGAGPVEADERDGPAAAVHLVGRRHVAVADQAGAELGRDRA